MNYTEPLSNQISRFFSCVGFGFILCVFYIAVKAFFRILSKSRTAEMISDGVFCLFATVISFFYMIINNNGLVRLNLVIAQLAGGLILYFTVGRHVLRLLYVICDIVNRLINNLLYPIRVYLKAFYNVPSRVIVAFKRIFNKKKEKTQRIKRKKFKLLQKSS